MYLDLLYSNLRSDYFKVVSTDPVAPLGSVGLSTAVVLKVCISITVAIGYCVAIGYYCRSHNDRHHQRTVTYQTVIISLLNLLHIG